MYKYLSRFGDIVCEGTVEGNIKAEIFGDGDFVSKILVSNILKVNSNLSKNNHRLNVSM